jgi:hypothetical protein
VLPNANEAFLDHLLDLGVGSETALAVTFLPLAMVAWADGNVAVREREAILRAAEERGVAPGTPARQVLESWLARKPGPALVEAWQKYVASLGSDLSLEERGVVRERLLGLARGVAEAAGGFLGVAKISAAEKAMLEDLERTLR